MRLVELFDSPVEVSKFHDTGFGHAVTFKIAGDEYVIDYSPHEIMDSYENYAEEGAEVPAELEELAAKDPYIMDVSFYLVDGEHQNWQITGTGNELRVFSTVIAATEKYLQYQPKIEYLHISAKEASRVKLYDRLIASFKKPTFSFTPPIGGEKVYIVKAR